MKNTNKQPAAGSKPRGPRERIVSLRFAASEFELLQAAADANGRTLSQEIRWRCLGPDATARKTK